MRRTLSTWLVAGLAAALAPTARAEQIRLSLNSVRVVQQREAAGDRPYFASLTLETQLCTPGSTRVTVMEREPHDWVAYSQHTRGRLGSADHMIAGNRVPIPTWMGETSFNNVELMPLMVGDTFHPDLSRARIFGAAYFGFDNNNTPPHIVRHLMQAAQQAATRVLQEEVESRSRCGVLLAGVVGGDTTEISERIANRLHALSQELLDDWQRVGLFLNLTAGSTFNPDQPTGVNVVLVPAVSGLPALGPSERFAFPLPAGEVISQTWVLAPQNQSRTLTFEGSGAVYTTPLAVRVTPEAAAETLATRLHLRIQTGRDDLRGGNDNVFASVLIGGRWRRELMLNAGGERWADNTIHDAFLPIGSTPLSQIEAIRLRATLGGGFDGDNWNVDGIRVEWRGVGNVGGLLYERAGTPFQCFTGEERELIILLQ